MALKIRSNDKVVIITGKDKGKIGVVKKIISPKKIIVEGINLFKKHQKPIPSQNRVGGILERELPIDVSNVKILNYLTNKPDRVGFRFEKGKKVRFFKSNNQIIKQCGENKK